MQVNVSKPSTVYIHFKSGTPGLFKLLDKNGKIYYFRYTDGKVPRIKFNIPDVGEYTSPTDFDIVKIGNIEVPKNLPRLPPAERDRYRDEVIKFNPNLTNTPARIFTEMKPAVIETSRGFYELPDPIKLFLLLHEKGHQFYKTEDFCDLYALVNYLRMGYNRSMGYYSLIKILSRTKQNIERTKKMFETINKHTGEEFNPGI
jgi:hypothetical protein